MLRKTLIALVAGSGVLFTVPASARPSGGIWSSNGPSKKRPKRPSQPKPATPAPAEPTPGENSAAAANADAPAGANSQGSANANLEAVSTANANSALAAGAVPSTALPGLTTGLSVKTSAGASLGTVSQVVTGEDGSIRLVVVTAADGRTYRLMPDQLSIAGGVVTTSQAVSGS
jgi:hypothetical protein